MNLFFYIFLSIVPGVIIAAANHDDSTANPVQLKFIYAEEKNELKPPKVEKKFNHNFIDPDAPGVTGPLDLESRKKRYKLRKSLRKKRQKYLESTASGGRATSLPQREFSERIKEELAGFLDEVPFPILRNKQLDDHGPWQNEMNKFMEMVVNDPYEEDKEEDYSNSVEHVHNNVKDMPHVDSKKTIDIENENVNFGDKKKQSTLNEIVERPRKKNKKNTAFNEDNHNLRDIEILKGPSRKNKKPSFNDVQNHHRDIEILKGPTRKKKETKMKDFQNTIERPKFSEAEIVEGPDIGLTSAEVLGEDKASHVLRIQRLLNEGTEAKTGKSMNKSNTFYPTRSGTKKELETTKGINRIDEVDESDFNSLPPRLKKQMKSYVRTVVLELLCNEIPFLSFCKEYFASMSCPPFKVPCRITKSNRTKQRHLYEIRPIPFDENILSDP